MKCLHFKSAPLTVTVVPLSSSTSYMLSLSKPIQNKRGSPSFFFTTPRRPKWSLSRISTVQTSNEYSGLAVELHTFNVASHSCVECNFVGRCCDPTLGSLNNCCVSKSFGVVRMHQIDSIDFFVLAFQVRSSRGADGSPIFDEAAYRRQLASLLRVNESGLIFQVTPHDHVSLIMKSRGVM